MNAPDHSAALAHYQAQAALAVARSAVDLLTAKYEEVEVTLQDAAKCCVRAEWDDDSGPIIYAVYINGAWLYPEDVLLPSRIECMVAELCVKHNETEAA